MSEKLVRDKMPDICKSDPTKTPMNYRVAKEQEMAQLLAIKLIEEANELSEAVKNRDIYNILEEMADVEEVLLTPSHYLDISCAQLVNVKKNKLIERGGFYRGIVWDGKK